MWDPTGECIVTFVHDDPANSDHDLWVAGSDGSDPHRIIDDPTREWYPSWSPDGTLIGYQGFDADGKIDVRTVRPDGTGLQILQVGPGNDGDGPLDPGSGRIGHPDLHPRRDDRGRSRGVRPTIVSVIPQSDPP